MSLKKRLKAAGIIAIAAAAVFGIARSGLAISEKQEETVYWWEGNPLSVVYG